MQYRKDIDGLRALAVIPVVLYHSRVNLFGGGYVGVDIFFVISGFLITQLIDGQLETGSFSILSFYERRARRILPALFLIILVCYLSALFLFVPPELRDFSRSAIATTLFSSNIFFWTQAGYFDTLSALKPLLHTWSLAVEEQYYIFFPMLMIGLARIGRKWTFAVLGVGGLLSFVLCVIVTRRYAEAAFFLSPFRAWEFVLGALLALKAAPRLPNRTIAEVTAWIGVALLVTAIFGFTDETPFPGWQASIPCLGAALLIHANTDHETSVAWFLKLRPIVFVGLISYSLYLWHWPMIVFLDAAGLDIPDRFFAATILLSSTALAYISWRFVEQPFRNRKAVSRRRIFVFAGTSAAVFLAFSGVAIAERGWPQRFEPGVDLLASYLDYNGSPEFMAAYRDPDCFSADEDNLPEKESCYTSAPGEASAFLWGDSHAAHYSAGLREWAKRKSLRLNQETMSGCQPILVDYGTPHCRRFRNTVIDHIRHSTASVIILSAHWFQKKNRDADRTLRGLKATIAAIRSPGRRIVVIGPSIEYTMPVPLLLAQYERSGYAPHYAPKRFVERRTFAFDRNMQKNLAGIPDVTYVSVLQAACKNYDCPAEAKDGTPIAWDKSHLTKRGSERVVASFAGLL